MSCWVECSSFWSSRLFGLDGLSMRSTTCFAGYSTSAAERSVCRITGSSSLYDGTNTSNSLMSPLKIISRPRSCGSAATRLKWP